MSIQQVEDGLRELNINPDSSLHIHLHIGDDSHHREAPALCQYLRTERFGSTVARIPNFEDSPSQHIGLRSQHDPADSFFNLEYVFRLPMRQLGDFQSRVIAMERSNFELVRSLVGEFPEGQLPFPTISCIDPEQGPKEGSPQHRELLWAQYRNMCRIQNDPTQCLNLKQSKQNLRDRHEQLSLLEQWKTQPESVFKNDSGHQSYFMNLPLQAPLSGIKMSGERSDVSAQPDPPARVVQRADNPALFDYQMQLMLLEQQNKKRLMLAGLKRDNSENGPSGSPASPFLHNDPVDIFGSDYHMQLMLLEQQNKKRLLCSRQEKDANN